MTKGKKTKFIKKTSDNENDNSNIIKENKKGNKSFKRRSKNNNTVNVTIIPHSTTEKIKIFEGMIMLSKF